MTHSLTHLRGDVNPWGNHVDFTAAEGAGFAPCPTCTVGIINTFIRHHYRLVIESFLR